MSRVDSTAGGNCAIALSGFCLDDSALNPLSWFQAPEPPAATVAAAAAGAASAALGSQSAELATQELGGPQINAMGIWKDLFGQATGIAEAALDLGEPDIAGKASEAASRAVHGERGDSEDVAGDLGGGLDDLGEALADRIPTKARIALSVEELKAAGAALDASGVTPIERMARAGVSVAVTTLAAGWAVARAATPFGAAAAALTLALDQAAAKPEKQADQL